MIIFNGKAFAAQKEQELLAKIQALQSQPTETQKVPRVGCMIFSEDQGGMVYAQEKKQVAKRLGIEYDIVQVSLNQDRDIFIPALLDFANDPNITGIIIQKPWRKNWEAYHPQADSPQDFQDWWLSITDYIPQSKDIDGLTRDTLASIKAGDWEQKKLALPATCKAILSIMKEASTQLSRDVLHQKTLIIGRSDLMGTPLSQVLRYQGNESVTLVGQAGFEKLTYSPTKLTEFSTIISSTGLKKLVKGDMVVPDCVVIDAGFPDGDVDFDSVSSKAAFITPVPNGVGPVTVISLLENTVELCYNFGS